MVARGNRALGAYHGYVICEGDPMTSQALREQCIQNTGPNYKEAALLILTLREFGRKGNKS